MLYPDAPVNVPCLTQCASMQKKKKHIIPSLPPRPRPPRRPHSPPPPRCASGGAGAWQRSAYCPLGAVPEPPCASLARGVGRAM
eukprot:1797367-Pyramimonas_sp.AAC.1